MQVTVHRKRVFDLLDVLLARWTATPKKYPYNRPDAVIPQTIIPAKLRANKFALVCFYTFVCIHMKGRIESLQAFKAYIRMWELRPPLIRPAFRPTS